MPQERDAQQNFRAHKAGLLGSRKKNGASALARFILGYSVRPKSGFRFSEKAHGKKTAIYSSAGFLRRASRLGLFAIFPALALENPSDAALNRAKTLQSTPVAVAANFAEPAKEIAALFKARTGRDVSLSFGPSGPFLAQITQGAPFQVFLSADAERPRKLVEQGLAEKSDVYAYAIGVLVLWSKQEGFLNGEEILKKGAFQKLAIANPEAAPYGAAGLEVLKKLSVYESIAPKIVQGASIAQAFQFVDSGNAELGFIALSQIFERKGGSRWIVPQSLYTPISQDAVLLKSGKADEGAKAFFEFLRDPQAREIIAKYGYGLTLR